jgi:hypothetical protein
LYFGLTGQTSFDGDNPVEIATKQVYEIPPAPSSIFTAISSATDDAVMRSIAKRPSDRWPDGDAMAEGLEAILRQRGSASRHAGLTGVGDSGMTNRTPLQIVLSDTPANPVPRGETQRVDVASYGRLVQPVVPSETPVTDPRLETVLTQTPIPGLVPLTPVPAHLGDFEVPNNLVGQTPPYGTPGLGLSIPPASGDVPVGPEGGTTGETVIAGSGETIHSRRRFRSLILTVIGVLILGIVLYVQWNTRAEKLKPTRGGIVAPSDDRLAELERETTQARLDGRLLDMIKVWQEFVDQRERERPGDPAISIGEEYIRWLRAQIAPLQATDELVRRRLDRAQMLLSEGLPAIANAYTEKNVDLFGRSSSYNERVDSLRRLIERDAYVSDPSQVRPLIAQARQALLQANVSDRGPLIDEEEKRAESLLLRAVQAGPLVFEAWMAAGQFYLDHFYLDDARVFFMMAVDRASNGQERGTATQRLESLPNQ